ncbi:NAD(P)/FAD-dependent oxidoreductase [Wukongibacter baidiensis]|uniref:NAD(P)/FAD-dependent oxidoreductase n=1 Tax=Wukongibacter baidiensis TaxID=1723361 RepID=UPI003D7FFC4D
MKVAIIGAGVAGLSCALELEKYGVKPVVYEKNNFIGEMHPHVTAIFDVIVRHLKNQREDMIDYFKYQLDKDIEPLNPIYSVVHNSPRNQSIIRGNLGYFFKRGREKDGLKCQLYSQLRDTKIIFNNLADYDKLSKAYDKVIVATGNTNFTKELGCVYTLFSSMVRGAIVLGNFDPTRLIMWINQDYCKNGYAYLTPFNKKKATLVLITNDVNDEQMDYYWNKFLFEEDIKYTIVEEFKLKHETGYIYPNRVGNIYLVGGARGGIEPFLGFGQMNSLTAGTLVARAIAEGKDYDKLLKTIDSGIRKMIDFRRVYNRMNNKGYDIFVPTIGLPGVKQLIYDTNLDIAKIGGSVLGILNKIYERNKRQGKI